MNKENGFAYQVLVLIIIIIIAIAGVLINKLVGRNGMIEKVTEVESKFSKEDVLEKINYKVTQKFIELNNTAKASNQSISSIYNSDVVLAFLKENLIIEEIKNEAGEPQEGIYWIHVENLKNGDVHYTGKFQLEKRQEKYMIIWYDEVGNSEEIGELLALPARPG